MFGDAAPDTDHQLLAGEGQWIFNLNGEKYYLHPATPFSAILLPMCNKASEDELASDLDHRLGPCRYFDDFFARLC